MKLSQNDVILIPISEVTAAICFRRKRQSCFSICSPCIPDRHQRDVTVRAELQDAVLRLDPDPKQLDVLRRVGAHTCALLRARGKKKIK